MTWDTVNVLSIPQARDIAGKLAGKILNILEMNQVGTSQVLCPFPCDVLVMYWPGTLALTPSEFKCWCLDVHSVYLYGTKNHRLKKLWFALLPNYHHLSAALLEFRSIISPKGSTILGTRLSLDVQQGEVQFSTSRDSLHW